MRVRVDTPISDKVNGKNIRDMNRENFKSKELSIKYPLRRKQSRRKRRGNR